VARPYPGFRSGVNAKPLRLRSIALADLDDIAGRYAAEAGIPVAVRLAEAVERAVDHITRHPARGSLRYGNALNTPGLRFWPLRRFPYLVFYVEEADHVDVWRVLHARSDLPNLLRESDQ
jgi:toxin ParE1/3/4